MGTIEFNGSDYVSELDRDRLSSQTKRIFHLMKDKKFRTLKEIEEITGDPQSSISAQLRHLRKGRFGSHTINKQRRSPSTSGIFEYQLIVNEV